MSNSKQPHVMNADNVTPIRNLHGEMSDLIDELYETAGNIPADGLEEGYFLSAQTQLDLRRVISQLQESLQILERARDYEDALYNSYYDARHPEEAAD